MLLIVVMTGLRAAADDPKPADPEPPRLKKKVKPDAEKKKDEKPPPRIEEKKDTEPQPDPAEEAKEILARIGKNLQTTEKRLADRDPGDGTRQTQRDIVKDLDALIEQIKQQQQQNSPQGGGGMGRMGKTSQQQAEREKSRRDSRPSSQRDQGSEAREKADNQAGKGGQSPEDMNKLADRFKDIWGHLPEALRQEIDAYARQGYMLKYNDLLRQYYTTLAEKGREGEGKR